MFLVKITAALKDTITVKAHFFPPYVSFARLTIRSCFTVNSSWFKGPTLSLSQGGWVHCPLRKKANLSHLGVSGAFYWPIMLY